MNDKSQEAPENQVLTLASGSHSPASAAVLLDAWSRYRGGSLTQDEVKNLVRVIDGMLDRAWTRVIRQGWADDKVDGPDTEDDEALPF